MTTPDAIELPEFGTISDLIRQHAHNATQRSALIEGGRKFNYATLDALMDRVAAALQRDGLQVGDTIAIRGQLEGRCDQTLARWPY